MRLSKAINRQPSKRSKGCGKHGHGAHYRHYISRMQGSRILFLKNVADDTIQSVILMASTDNDSDMPALTSSLVDAPTGNSRCAFFALDISFAQIQLRSLGHLLLDGPSSGLGFIQEKDGMLPTPSYIQFLNLGNRYMVAIFRHL